MGRKFISFKFAADKARDAIHKLVCDQPDIDLHTLLKSCYFADKEHLRKYNRPIFGATYQAMKFGPVPLEIYEMAKGEAYWLAELGETSFPWELKGFRLSARPRKNDCHPSLGNFSKTDLEELMEGHQKARTMTFSERTAATHQNDWQKANLGIMRYEDMLEGVPDYERKVKHLKEVAHKMRL